MANPGTEIAVLSTIGELKAELERVQKQAAAMREALLQVCDAEVSHSNALANCCNIPSAQSDHEEQIAAMRMKAAQSLATQALADDAGANYVSKDQVRPLVVALDTLRTCSATLGYVGLAPHVISTAIAHARSLGL